jgi:predicted Zn-dependent protease
MQPKPPIIRRSGIPAPSAVAGSLLLALAVLAACATTGINRGDVNLVSLDEEWQLGRQLERDLQGKLKLVHDRATLDYVNRVGRRIVAQTELRDRRWEFHVVADPEVNAFNIPGGHVYVNTGLIAAAGDAAQFAGVMAHEIGHGVARHATEQLTAAYGLQIVAGAVLGKDPAAYQRILAQVAGAGALAKYGRDAEREADGLGVRYMAAAGYDPDGMAAMFQRLLEQRRRRPSSVERFFSSHPLTEERIAYVEREAAKVDRPGLTRSEPGFQDVRRRLAR